MPDLAGEATPDTTKRRGRISDAKKSGKDVQGAGPGVRPGGSGTQATAGRESGLGGPGDGGKRAPHGEGLPGKGEEGACLGGEVTERPAARAGAEALCLQKVRAGRGYGRGASGAGSHSGCVAETSCPHTGKSQAPRHAQDGPAPSSEPVSCLAEFSASASAAGVRVEGHLICNSRVHQVPHPLWALQGHRTQGRPHLRTCANSASSPQQPSHTWD